MKIKKGDTVIILSGKDSGKNGKVERVFVKKDKVVVSGLNQLKKSVKPSKKHPKGGIISVDSPINISNIMLLCPNCGKKTKTKMEIKNNKKNRICIKCNNPIDFEAKKK